MSESASWENVCCRCDSDVQVNLYPGERACHVTCGRCLYPDSPTSASCEIAEYCAYAPSYPKSLEPNGMKKGCYFRGQLTEEETLYHTLHYVNGQKHLVGRSGEKRYLEDLRKANSASPCLRQ